LDISENKSEIPEKFQNVVLEMEKVSGTNRVPNEGVLHRVKEEISYQQYKKGILTGLVTSCIEIAF
jgi:hypothetical protein